MTHNDCPEADKAIDMALSLAQEATTTPSSNLGLPQLSHHCYRPHMSGPRKLNAAQKASILADKSGLVYVTPRPNDDLEWIGAYRLDGGSYGEVTMWICIDKKTRRPIHHCAIKDTFDRTPNQEKDAYFNVYSTLVHKGITRSVSGRTSGTLEE